MYIETVPNRNPPPAILLRESYRDGESDPEAHPAQPLDWPPERVEGLRGLLKGGVVLPPGEEAFTIERSLPHGAVAAVARHGARHRPGPAARAEERAEPNRPRDLVLAMIVSRIIAPASKLATAKALDPATAASSLGVELGLGRGRRGRTLRRARLAATSARARSRPRSPSAISRAARWCSTTCRRAMSRAAAARWPSAATTATARRASCRSSTACCARPTAARSRSRCSRATPATPAPWPIRSPSSSSRFALDHVVLVGDRGMITQARIDEDLRPAGLDWITALRAPAIRAWSAAAHLQMSLFDERDMAAITSPDFPGERLIVCRNPDLARERARKREDLLAATERDLAKIAASRRAQGPPAARRGRDRHRPSAPCSTSTRWPSISN